MVLIEHLEEVRSRLIISIAAVLATTVLAYVFSDAILALLRAPAGSIKLIGLSPMDGFMIRFRVALYGGLILAAPIWIFQVLRFLEPALLPKEKRLIIPGVVAAVALFVVGNIFGYLMLQKMMGVFLGMFGSSLEYMPTADNYISFITYFLIIMGAAFELPIILLAMVKLGLVSPQFLRRQRRIVYFGIFVLAELITPAVDPIVAPLVVMSPMIALFEVALFATRFITPKPAVNPPLAAGASVAE
jgi:sec-independent protein translocase protein TatC